MRRPEVVTSLLRYSERQVHWWGWPLREVARSAFVDPVHRSIAFAALVPGNDGWGRPVYVAGTMRTVVRP